MHDDASNDDSVAYIRDHYPQVSLLVSTENCGFCVSNNRMANMLVVSSSCCLIMMPDYVLAHCKLFMSMPVAKRSQVF